MPDEGVGTLERGGRVSPGRLGRKVRGNGLQRTYDALLREVGAVRRGAFCREAGGLSGRCLGGLTAGGFAWFLGMSEVPENAALSGLSAAGKVAKSSVWQRCNWDRGRYSPREI